MILGIRPVIRGLTNLIKSSSGMLPRWLSLSLSLPALEELVDGGSGSITKKQASGGIGNHVLGCETIRFFCFFFPDFPCRVCHLHGALFALVGSVAW